MIKQLLQAIWNRISKKTFSLSGKEWEREDVFLELKRKPYWKNITAEPYHKEKLIVLMKKYKFRMPNDVLIPSVGLNFVDDSAAIGIAALGVSGWYFVKGEFGIRKRDSQYLNFQRRTPEGIEYLVEDIATQYYVGDRIILRDDPVKDSSDSIKRFISEIPDYIDKVSLDLLIPLSWNAEITNALQHIEGEK